MPRITVNYSTSVPDDPQPTEDMVDALQRLLPYVFDNVSITVSSHNPSKALTVNGLYDAASFVETFEGEPFAFDSNSGAAGLQRYDRILDALHNAIILLEG